MFWLINKLAIVFFKKPKRYSHLAFQEDKVTLTKTEIYYNYFNNYLFLGNF